jgi:hypothetical protein
MGSRGPKLKTGDREPNGRLSRAAAAAKSLSEALNEVNRQNALQEMAVVLAQPHRRGSEDKRCASALGRFVLAQGLRSEVYDAGIEYAALVNRWRAAKGIPTTVRQGIGGNGEGPSDATVQSWASQIARIELAIVPISHPGFLAMRRLALDDENIPSGLFYDAAISLGALAQAMGRLPQGGHPFLAPPPAAA